MVPVTSVRVGDFISDRGCVTNVRHFAGPVANGVSKALPAGTPYYQQVSNEVNSCYSWVVDRVVVETTFGTYCFLSDALVPVISFTSSSLRAAA